MYVISLPLHGYIRRGIEVFVCELISLWSLPCRCLYKKLNSCKPKPYVISWHTGHFDICQIYHCVWCFSILY